MTNNFQIWTVRRTLYYKAYNMSYALIETFLDPFLDKKSFRWILMKVREKGCRTTIQG